MSQNFDLYENVWGLQPIPVAITKPFSIGEVLDLEELSRRNTPISEKFSTRKNILIILVSWIEFIAELT